MPLLVWRVAVSRESLHQRKQYVLEDVVGIQRRIARRDELAHEALVPAHELGPADVLRSAGKRPEESYRRGWRRCHDLYLPELPAAAVHDQQAEAEIRDGVRHYRRPQAEAPCEKPVDDARDSADVPALAMFHGK